jgi:hypothetical protein
MGSFSDSLFGSKRRMDPNKVNSFMADYDKGVGEQMDMARQMMDPTSGYSRQRQQLIRSNMMDQTATQNQSLLGMAAASGMNPAQAAMQARANMHTARGQAGQQFDQGMQNQMSAGQSLFSTALQGQQQIGERGANMYMQEVNAHNQARQQNMATAMQGVGALASLSDKKLKYNIELVGKSPKGVNIYEFDYKNKSHGKGRYRGVMAQEVPNAAFKGYNGYLWVDYNKVDVNFERIN